MPGGFVDLVEVIGRDVLRRHPIFLIGPGAKVNQLASFGTERPKWVGFRPFDRLFASGAFNIHIRIRAIGNMPVLRIQQRPDSIVPVLPAAFQG